MEHILFLVSIILLLFLSGFFSSCEVAFFSIKQSELDDIKEKHPNRYIKIQKLISNPNYLLACLLIANNLVNIGIVILSVFYINLMFPEIENMWLFYFFQVVVITLIILILGESLPKTLATYKTKELVIIYSPLLYYVEKIFHPISTILVRSTKIFDESFRFKNVEISMKDLSEVIELTKDQKSNDENQKLLEGITQIHNVEVSEIMTRRLDVVAIEKTTPFKEVLNIIRDAGYSRIPVYDETLDNIIGVLYIKDLLNYLDKEEFDWVKIIRNPFFVPEGKKINDLLLEFQQKKIHLAIVVDEYGGFSGIITLEDIIEEIFGDIKDEFDTDEGEFVKISENCYIFNAKTSLVDFCKYTGINISLFDEITGEPESLGGLILELYGDIPEKNDIIHFKNLSFRIESADERKINKIRVIIKNG